MFLFCENLGTKHKNKFNGTRSLPHKIEIIMESDFFLVDLHILVLKYLCLMNTLALHGGKLQTATKSSPPRTGKYQSESPGSPLAESKFHSHDPANPLQWWGRPTHLQVTAGVYRCFLETSATWHLTTGSRKLLHPGQHLLHKNSSTINQRWGTVLGEVYPAHNGIVALHDWGPKNPFPAQRNEVLKERHGADKSTRSTKSLLGPSHVYVDQKDGLGKVLSRIKYMKNHT